MTQQEMRFGGLSLTQTGHFNFEHTESRFLIDKLWLRGGTGILSGPPKKGKTWLVLDAAISVAAGVPFLDKYPTTQGPVVLYSPEGKTEELENRIAQISVRKGIVQKALPLYIATSKKLTLDSGAHQEEIREVCRAVNPTLLIFDPIARCFDGIESNADDVKYATGFINSLAAEFDCAVMLTHHDSKDGTALRGSGVWLSFGDCYWFLRANDERLTLDFAFKNQEKPAPLPLAITTENGNSCISIGAVAATTEEKTETLDDRILSLMAIDPKKKWTVREMRETLKGDFTKYGPALERLKKLKVVREFKGGGYALNGAVWFGRTPKGDAQTKPSARTKPSFPPTPIGVEGKEGNSKAVNG